jgi:hypothetical protein
LARQYNLIQYLLRRPDSYRDTAPILFNNKFSVKPVSLYFLTSGKKLNPGGHAKLSGISVIEKL